MFFYLNIGKYIKMALNDIFFGRHFFISTELSNIKRILKKNFSDGFMHKKYSVRTYTLQVEIDTIFS